MNPPAHLHFPFGFDARGRTAAAGDAEYVRHLIELLLFISPGERVNRPEFGGGVRPLVFAPNGPELEAAVRATVQANLQRWLDRLIEVRDLAVRAAEATLEIDIKYVLRVTGEPRTYRLTRAV